MTARSWFRVRSFSGSRTLRNFISGVVLLTLQSVSYLVLAPLVLHHLGGEALGIWGWGSTLLALATLFDFGTTEAVSQRVGAIQGALSKAPHVVALCAGAARRYLVLASLG